MCIVYILLPKYGKNSHATKVSEKKSNISSSWFLRQIHIEKIYIQCAENPAEDTCTKINMYYMNVYVCVCVYNMYIKCTCVIPAPSNPKVGLREVGTAKPIYVSANS